MKKEQEIKSAVPSAEPQLGDILINAETIAKKAIRHKHSLLGGGFYASKFSESQAEANLNHRRLVNKLSNFNEPSITTALSEIESHLATFFDTGINATQRGEARKRILFLVKTAIDPAMTATPTHTPTDDLFPLDLVRGTRGYIERVAEQACGCYDQGWYDASAVMCRRLLETLIIETFETYKLELKIKNPDGNFFLLKWINYCAFE